MPRPNLLPRAPSDGPYRTVLSSDDPWFGGSGYPARGQVEVKTSPCHGFLRSMTLDLPPLSALILVPDRAAAPALAPTEADTTTETNVTIEPPTDPTPAV